MKGQLSEVSRCPLLSCGGVAAKDLKRTAYGMQVRHRCTLCGHRWTSITKTARMDGVVPWREIDAREQALKDALPPGVACYRHEVEPALRVIGHGLDVVWEARRGRVRGLPGIAAIEGQALAVLFRQRWQQSQQALLKTAPSRTDVTVRQVVREIQREAAEHPRIAEAEAAAVAEMVAHVMLYGVEPTDAEREAIFSRVVAPVLIEELGL